MTIKENLEGKLTSKAQVGDVIMSQGFISGFILTNENATLVGVPEDCLIPKYSDQTRTNAKYVVEKALMVSGGWDRGPLDVFPDSWRVCARRLNKNGTYNPKGELIEFYQGGPFMSNLPEVKVVGKMEMRFFLQSGGQDESRCK